VRHARIPTFFADLGHLGVETRHPMCGLSIGRLSLSIAVRIVGPVLRALDIENGCSADVEGYAGARRGRPDARGAR